MMQASALYRLPLAAYVSFLCAVSLAGEPGASPDGATHPPPGYSLVWKDDFSGDALDESKWHLRTDVKADSSQRPENVAVENGYLTIWLRKEKHRGKEFTGGGVISKARFRYGYFEARVKMHAGAGWHQSVWAMAGDGTATFHAGIRTEIDGMEIDSDDTTKGHMGLHRWHGPSAPRSSTCSPGVYRVPLGFDAAAGFHVYGFEWTESEVRFYLDGELRCVLDYPPTEHEHDPLNFWLTAIAVARRGTGIDESELPGRMIVDHAYVYQKDVYVDDGESGYSEEGAWETVGGFGYSRSDWRRSCVEGAAAVWRPKLAVGGDYEVFLYRHPQSGTGGKAVVEVSSSGAPHSQTIDFSYRSPGWTSLGIHRFDPDEASAVRLTRTEGCVAADMVKFVRVE